MEKLTLQFQQHTCFFFNLKHWTDWWFWNMTFIFPFSSECHHPNWLIFFRGVGIPPTSIAVFDGWIDTWMIYLYIYNHMYIIYCIYYIESGGQGPLGLWFPSTNQSRHVTGHVLGGELGARLPRLGVWYTAQVEIQWPGAYLCVYIYIYIYYMYIYIYVSFNIWII